jgi:hypothetical protein
MKTFSIKHIFSEYKSLYIALGILYLILVINVIPKIVKEYQNTQANTQANITSSKIDLAYFIITFISYIIIAILYLGLSYVSGDHNHKHHSKRI